MQRPQLTKLQVVPGELPLLIVGQLGGVDEGVAVAFIALDDLPAHLVLGLLLGGGEVQNTGYISLCSFFFLMLRDKNNCGIIADVITIVPVEKFSFSHLRSLLLLRLWVLRDWGPSLRELWLTLGN